MLFNSYSFIFIFLPIAIAGFYGLGMLGYRRLVILWLVGSSLFFYGWWNPLYLWLICGSISFNYLIGFLVIPRPDRDQRRKLVLILGIAGNLLSIGYFKYANFFVDTINSTAGTSWTLEKIILPLAISFFTFQQITYLVDSYQGRQKDRDFLHYCLFVTFFPQLIAGPIVHHAEMLPQFAKESLYKPKFDRFAIGLTIFFIGLFKKTVLADGIGIYADRVFNAVETGAPATFLEAWVGALSYSFQIYFDFSGYSDMAIGLALLFGVRLPLNFFSPYRSQSIIDFWRRWHMTLSRFLRDYIYIPLGGNRGGKNRRNINIMITMLLGGLWHGAGWTFIIWGGLHGAYILTNHLWRHYSRKSNFGVPRRVAGSLSWTLTFFAVVIAWVFFRAESLGTANELITSMLGFNGIVLPDTYAGYLGALATPLTSLGINFEPAITIPNFQGISQITELCALLLICLLFPNTYELTQQQEPTVTPPDTRLVRRYLQIQWQPTLRWSVGIGITGLFAVLNISDGNKFLYFNF